MIMREVMNDLSVEILKDLWRYSKSERFSEEQIRAAIDYAILVINMFGNQRWIPCTEKPPEGEVLCCDIQNNIMLGYVFVDMTSESGFSAENENCFMYECVAWMPKPEGYVKEGE